jgi:hypothetical protein
MKDFTRINCLHVAQLTHNNRRFSTRRSCRASNKSVTRTIRKKMQTASSPPIFLFQISECKKQRRNQSAAVPINPTLQLPPLLHEQQLVAQRLLASVGAD